MSKATNKRRSAKQQPAPQPVPMEVDDDANMSEDEEGGTRIGGIYIPPPIPPHCSTEAKGPRMIIRNIYNTNFKSYAGTVVLGPFHQRFSAIIGPNGSGKSNVIDSMLFVFGYRAQKIRSKKLSVLLHNSTRHPNINSCTVAVHFIEILDKEDGSFEELAGTEVVVARTAFRDNSSYYTINDRRVHFKEVAALLRKHGIDLDHNRFLILQGEVESISMMKPKALTDNECGLLEYLEDIIGTTRYKVPLIKINECVEKLNEERTEKHNRCKLAEREMKDLEQPKNEAVEFLKLKNTYTRTQNLQIQKYLHEQGKRVTEFQTDKDAQLSVIQKHDAEYEELQKQRAEKEAFMKEEAKKYGGLEKQLEDADAQMKASLDKYAEIQANMTATNKRRKANMAQIEKEKEKIEDLKKVPEANKREIKECEQKAEKLNKQKQEAEDQLAVNYTTLKDETKALLEQKEKLQNELIDLKKTEDEAKSELTIAESELKLCKQNETTERRKLESMRTSFEDSKSSLDEQTTTLKELEETLPGIREKLEESKRTLEENRTEEKETVQQLRKIRAKVDESVNAMQQTKSQGRVLDALMQQKNQGNIPGILGRLGDLGAIDARYDVAISTCCGRLEWIVVDTVNTGQTCIEYLKKHNVGRASFITLEKVEYLTQQCQQRIQTPENVPRLFDLVRVEDNRVLPAFYYALRDTLVATDLDQGTRIAYGRQRFRVVTLGGDVIEIAGTMSGGGKSQMRGRMGQKVATKTTGSTPKSNKELEHLQRQAQELQSRVNFLQEQQGQLQREIDKLSSSARSKENEIKRLRITIQSLSEQLPRIQEQLKKQQTKVDNTQSDPERVRELEERVASNKTVFDKSKKAADKIQKQVDSFTTQITDITNTKVKAFQTKIAGLTKQIDKLTANISKLTVEITQSERNLKKTSEKIENLEAEVTAAQDSLRKSDEMRTEEGEKIETYTANIEKLKADLERIQGESAGVRKEIVEIQKRENEGKMKRLELEQILSVIEKKLADVQNGIPHWKRKLAPLKLDDIPGEEEPEPLKVYTVEELEEKQLEQIQYQMTAQEEQLSTLKPNLSVIAEYNHKREAYIQSFQVLEEITQKRNEMRQLFDDVKKKRFTEFMCGFNIITKKLKEMYQMITLGGDADLELVDSMDPFNEGIVFSVRPPKKSWKMISNLSGGEKTLSSLALVFALHYYKPSPLYVMDEIDAALDFKNVSIVAHYIKQRTKNAQFIIISLRSNMFELSDYLVGIYKVNDCTDSVTIENQPPIMDSRASKNLFLDSFATPNSQPPAFEATIQPEEEKENDRSNAQLPPTPPAQEMADVEMTEVA